MLTFGQPKILECSSRGDKRFSALYARIRWRNHRTIEDVYQSYKVFEGNVSGLSIKDAKGKRPINMDACRILYVI